MLKNDYIMQIINQFTEFLTQVLFRIKSGETEKTHQDIQTAAERFLGLKLDLILSLSNKELINMLSVNGEINVEKSYMAAQLLICEANIRDANNGSGSIEIYIRSLDLFLKSFGQMYEMLKIEAVPTINQILLVLRNQDLPIDIYRLLIPFYEHQGQYSKAEDCLFELVDNGFEEALQIGQSFYSRLLEKTDQELEHGNLPRSEVNEGLQELKAKVAI